MTRAERRRQLKLRRQICWIGTLLLVIGILLVRLTPSLTHANLEEGNINKYYTSIEIESGDTLWDIADHYCTVPQVSKKEYIAEVKRTNHLSSSQITAGMHLCVPYYEIVMPEASASDN